MASESSRDAAAAGQPVLANAERHYQVTAADLPLACPMPDMTLWNSHPRVYLPIVENGGTARCDYCGAQFELVQDKAAESA